MIATGCAGVLVGGACATGEQGKSGGDILADSVAAYQGAPSFRVQGHFSQAQHSYTLDLQVERPDSVAGTVTTDGKSVEVLELGTRTYLRGRAYLSTIAGDSAANLVGDRWVNYPSSDLAFALAQFASRTGVWQGLAAKQASVDKQSEMQVDGVDTIKLAGRNVAFYVALKGTNYPIRTEGAGDPSDPTGITNFQLDFSQYGDKFDIHAPADAVDFSNPNTLPPHFVVTNGNIGPQCGNFGCTLAAVVRNDGGPGDARIVFHLRAPNGTEIARCNSPIKGVPHGASKQVACWAYSANFQNYVSSVTVARLVVVPEVQNP